MKIITVIACVLLIAVAATVLSLRRFAFLFTPYEWALIESSRTQFYNDEIAWFCLKDLRKHVRDALVDRGGGDVKLLAPDFNTTVILPESEDFELTGQIADFSLLVEGSTASIEDVELILVQAVSEMDYWAGYANVRFDPMEAREIGQTGVFILSGRFSWDFKKIHYQISIQRMQGSDDISIFKRLAKEG